MTEEEKVIMQQFKDSLIVGLSDTYKLAIDRAFKQFLDCYPDIGIKYGKIIINDIGSAFKESWMYVGEKMITSSELPKNDP